MQRQKAKGNGKDSRHVNLYFDEVKSEIVKCYRDLKAETRVLTPQLIKARFLGEDKKIHSLNDIIEYHNEKMAIKLCAKTLCHYRTSQNYILAYVEDEYKISDIFLKDLDYAFVIGFESFLRSYRPKHYQGKIGNNAVMKHIQRLRKMVTLAYHIEWIELDPFVKFKPKLKKTEREFLTDIELEVIENLRFPVIFFRCCGIFPFWIPDRLFCPVPLAYRHLDLRCPVVVGIPSFCCLCNRYGGLSSSG